MKMYRYYSIFSTLIRRELTTTSTPNEKTFHPKLIRLVRQAIKIFGYQSKDGYTCIRTVCPICSYEDATHRPTIYINKITGLFLCPTCQNTQPWENVSDIFGKLWTAENNKEFENVRKRFIALKEVRAAYTFSEENLEEAKESTFKPYNINISNSMLADLRIKFSANRNKIHCPLVSTENIIVGEKIVSLLHPESEFTLPDKGCTGLLVHRNKEDRAIIVQNAVDFISIVSQKQIQASVLCLPYGLKSLNQELLPAFEQYKEIVLWFNFDSTDWDTAYSFARKLDETRCFFIRPTIDKPTPYLALKQGKNLKPILESAQPVLHKSITTFRHMKQDILCDLQNIDMVQGVKWKRYTSLNPILKGHRKGELTILTGNTGCGKTTFISDYSLDLAMQGVCTLWGSFEIRNTRLASTMLRQFVGSPLEERLNEFESFTEQIEKLPIYFMTFHGQQSIKVVMEAIEHAQYVYDIQHVIIDNVQFMMGTSTHAKHIEKFWEQDFIISEFRSFATKQNVHVTLVMHPRKERDEDELSVSSIFGSAKAAQEADNVLLIQDKRAMSVKGKKYLQIAKNRYSGDLGSIVLEFDKNSLSFTQPKKKKK